MTKSEIAGLLALIAAFDRRTVGEADIEAWHLILSDLDATDCAAAIRDHYTTRRDWIMPADVRTGAVAEQRRRQGRERRAELDAQIRREASGELRARPVAALTVGQDIPPARLLRHAVSAGKRQEITADTAAAAEHQARKEQARQELEAVRAAGGTA